MAVGMTASWATMFAARVSWSSQSTAVSAGASLSSALTIRRPCNADLALFIHAAFQPRLSVFGMALLPRGGAGRAGAWLSAFRLWLPCGGRGIGLTAGCPAGCVRRGAGGRMLGGDVGRMREAMLRLDRLRVERLVLDGGTDRSCSGAGVVLGWSPVRLDDLLRVWLSMPRALPVRDCPLDRLGGVLADGDLRVRDRCGEDLVTVLRVDLGLLVASRLGPRCSLDLARDAGLDWVCLRVVLGGEASG